ncbi:MAG: HIT domain-containing protein [Candidatus Levybacteria bacterium]|nr:HIT domain-containing protein [Candidatus Levybacteria bacterium]
MDCIFCKIAKKEIPKDFTYEDDEIMVFSDINPIASTHLLVVPKEHITDFLELKNDKLFGKLANTIQKMVKKTELKDKGYRLVLNGGGAQIIDHLHFHVVGPVGKKVKM